MSEEDVSEEDIQNAFEQACYGDLLQHAEAFKDTDELSEMLQLMAPYHIRKISRNSTKNLCELAGVVTSSAFEDIPNQGNSSLVDPLIYNREVKKSLTASFDWIDGRLDRFENKLNCFSSKLRQWQNEIGDEPFSVGLAAGVIVGVLAGPLGALAGGFLGGALSGDSVKEEFEREFQFLLQDYAGLIEEVQETLNDNFQLSFNSIQNYIKKIEVLDHEPKNLLPPS